MSNNSFVLLKKLPVFKKQITFVKIFEESGETNNFQRSKEAIFFYQFQTDFLTDSFFFNLSSVPDIFFLSRCFSINFINFRDLSHQCYFQMQRFQCHFLKFISIFLNSFNSYGTPRLNCPSRCL